jgi:predicted metal-dependent hydrolase
MPDFDELTLEENHGMGIGFFDGERFFPAHEAWETCWKQSKGTPDEEFFKGLSQLGAGYTHYLRGNAHGTFTLLRRGGGRISTYPSPHRDVDTDALSHAAFRTADLVERSNRAHEELPAIEFPRIGTPPREPQP